MVGEATSDGATSVLAGTLKEAGVAFCSQHGREKNRRGPAEEGCFSPLCQVSRRGSRTSWSARAGWAEDEMENHITIRFWWGRPQTPACHRVSLGHALREKHRFWSQTDLGSNPSYAIQQPWEPRQAFFWWTVTWASPISHASQYVCPHVVPSHTDSGFGHVTFFGQ